MSPKNDFKLVVSKGRIKHKHDNTFSVSFIKPKSW